MRQLSILLTLLTIGILSQGQDTADRPQPIDKKANFESIIDISQATKDGIYLSGYVVNIPYKKLTELNGKTVRIKGKVTIVKRTRHFYDREMRQGRKEVTRHILKPKIRLVAD